jgi:UDP-N-acetylglucosamine--N-acetylmuramyl-(pentapeptide) pyrophosphoryl-undecaprenol N-acetylglucosamine transferase
MEQKVIPIWYVAGHSGGHIIPCLTLAAQHKKENGGPVSFITTTKSLDRTIITGSTVVDKAYAFYMPQQRQWYMLPLLAAALAGAWLRALYLLVVHRPAMIVTTGSIIAIPVCLAAWILRIPITLFEVNAKPGKTIQLLAPFAHHIYVCFAQARDYFSPKITQLHPYPIRFARPESPLPSPAHFDTTRCTLFIQGGSQGSRGINNLIRELLVAYPALGTQLQIIHQTGDAVEYWRAFYDAQHIPAYVFSYEPDVAAYYHAADMVICRSGAGALFETLYFQKFCITIPLTTTTTSHQHDNAVAMAYNHPELFYVVEQDSTAISTIATIISSYRSTAQKINKFAKNIRI